MSIPALSIQSDERAGTKRKLPEENKMNQISCTVDTWVDEESLPVTPTLKVIRVKDPWYGMSEEEVEDRKEFIRCYINKDFELLLQIPIQPSENDFWFSSHQELMESAFNTWDFQRGRKPFDKCGYRIKKIMEEVKDLAILHSSITSPDGRTNIYRRYENLVENEFRGRLMYWVEQYKRVAEEERRPQVRRRIAELNRRILQCQKVWEEYAHWE